MADPTLFGPVDPMSDAAKGGAAATSEPRLATANRGQIQWGPIDLDARLPQDHVARVLWDLLGRLDLSRFYAWIKASGSLPGRPATDPKILLTLWVLATTDAVTSADEVARLCTLHDAYRWVCGGVSVCDHVLSDFRTQHAEAVDGLITQILAVLLRQGTLTMERVAHDGMRVRASAGAASFRREASLEKHAADAEAYLEQVKRDAAKPDNEWSRREAAAKERGARLRLESVEEALRELPKVKEAKLKAAKRQGPAAFKAALDAQSAEPPVAAVVTPGEAAESPATNGSRGPAATRDTVAPPGEAAELPVGASGEPSSEAPKTPAREDAAERARSSEQAKKKLAPRVSTTDPQARVMKMGDGGFRPAYNFHFATDTRTRVIVGVLVTNSGADAGQMPVMLAEIKGRTGRGPLNYLVDGGFVRLEDIDRAEEAGTRVYAPVPSPNSSKVDPYKPKATDGHGTAEWRQRMATPEAKAVYKERASTAEGVNADVRVHRGLDRLLVRGLAKVTAIAFLVTLTYNLLRPVVIDALRAMPA